MERVQLHGALVYLETGDVIVIEEGEQIIGRNRPGFINSGRISRKHIKLSCVDGRYFIEDLGSTNGTKIKNEPLVSGYRRELQNGDIVSLAGELFSFMVTERIERGDIDSEKTVIG